MAETNYIYLNGSGDVVSASTGAKEITEPKLVALSVTQRVDYPDVSAVEGTVPLKYWKWNGSAVVEMSQAEKDTVDATLPGDSIPDEQLVYKVENIVQNRLIDVEYYKDEIIGFSGFSGFSGLGKKEFYDYQGSKIMGFSSVTYDTKGFVTSITKKTFATDANGKTVTRVSQIL